MSRLQERDHATCRRLKTCALGAGALFVVALVLGFSAGGVAPARSDHPRATGPAFGQRAASGGSGRRSRSTPSPSMVFSQLNRWPNERRGRLRAQTSTRCRPT